MVTQPFAFTGTTVNDLVVFTEGSLNTLANTFKGANPPPNIVAGQVWVDDTNDPTEWLLKLYDGVDHITVASVDPTGNTVTPFSAGSKLGTVANKNSGTANGEVPVLGVNGLPAIGGGDLTGTSLKSLAEAIKTADYTVVAAAAGKVVVANKATAITFNLTAAATLGAGFACFVKNIGVGDLTIDPASAETVDGAATKVLQQGESTFLWTDGSNWRTLGTILQDGPAPAAAPGLVPLNRTTVSSSVATVDIEGFFDSTKYDMYLIVGTRVRSVTDAQNLMSRWKMSSAYQTSNYSYAVYGVSAHSAGVPALVNDGTAGEILMVASTVGRALASDALSFTYWLPHPESTSDVRKYCYGEVVSARASSSRNVVRSCFGGDHATVNADIEGVQFKMSSGNIDQGEFYTYGLTLPA